MASTVNRSHSIDHLWDVVELEIRIMDVQSTNLQELHDAITVCQYGPKSLRNVFHALLHLCHKELGHF